MSRKFSERLRVDVNALVQSALGLHGTVNVPVIAETIRKRNLEENVALEDIEQLVLTQAQLLGAPMAFASNEAVSYPGAANGLNGHGLS